MTMAGGRHCAFLVTFTSFLCFHAVRKTFSAVKEDLIGGNRSYFRGDGIFGNDQQDEMGALLDTLFLFCYAIGLFLAGMVADRVDPRYALVAGQLLSGILASAFAAAGYANVRHILLFAALWGLQGLVQSIAFPCSIQVLSNWYPSGKRGTMLGLWGASSSLGNTVGGALALVAQRVMSHPSSSPASNSSSSSSSPQKNAHCEHHHARRREIHCESTESAIQREDGQGHERCNKDHLRKRTMAVAAKATVNNKASPEAPRDEASIVPSRANTSHRQHRESIVSRSNSNNRVSVTRAQYE